MVLDFLDVRKKNGHFTKFLKFCTFIAAWNLTLVSLVQTEKYPKVEGAAAKLRASHLNSV